MALEPKESYGDDAVGTLLQQDKDKANTEALVRSLNQPMDEIEDVVFEIQTQRKIDDASGSQLDGLGSIVGQARNGASDAQYRSRIRARIGINKSSGTVEDLIDIVQILQPGLTTQVRQLYPASMLIQLQDPIDPLIVDVPFLGNFIRAGRAACIATVITFGVIGAKQFDTASLGFDLGEFGGASQA